MADLILLHLLQYAPGFLILGCYLCQVFVQMPFDLFFCFRHESQAPSVTRDASGGAQHKGARIPERI